MTDPLFEPYRVWRDEDIDAEIAMLFRVRDGKESFRLANVDELLGAMCQVLYRMRDDHERQVAQLEYTIEQLCCQKEPTP